MSRNGDLHNTKQKTNHYTTLLDSRMFAGSQDSALFFAQFLERKVPQCSLRYRGSIQHGGKEKMNPSWPDSSSSYHRLNYSSTFTPCMYGKKGANCHFELNWVMCSESFISVSSKIRKKTTTPSSRITKNMWGIDILPVKAITKCKTEPSSCFPIKLILCGLSPFLQNRADMYISRKPLSPVSSGTRGGAGGWGIVLKTGRSRVRLPNWHFLPPHYGPGVDPASSINEYQEYFLRSKGGRCVGLTTLPSSCADCHEIWDPRIPGTLRAFPVLYRDCFTFFFPDILPPYYCVVTKRLRTSHCRLSATACSITHSYLFFVHGCCVLQPKLAGA